MGHHTTHPGGAILMAAKSYKMRMYQRRLWQERGNIILTGVAIWGGLALILILITGFTR